MDLNKKIVIIGGGPTGLGAAVRLRELGHTNWVLIEKENNVGGLSSSERDRNGFVWDIGGHVTFSHYKYYDDVLDKAVPDWVDHQREAWVWLKSRFVPYPFQNNIHRLPTEDIVKCLNSLVDVSINKHSLPKPENFDRWLLNNFGQGLYDIFLRPYNEKVWAFPPSYLSYGWMGERVAKVDINQVIKNTILKQDNVSWGPNSVFRFPKYNGTGSIWESIGRRFKSDIRLNSCVESIDTENKIISYLVDDWEKTESYEYIINTMPIDILIHNVACLTRSASENLGNLTKSLKHNSTHVIGIGLKGKIPPALETKCWMYFPEDQHVFFRCTIFSNYSCENAPKDHWSLMFEVNESTYNGGFGSEEKIKEKVIAGAVDAGLLDQENIVDIYYKKVEYGYPVPTIDRDAALNEIQPYLMGLGIYSRGRFGGYKYEVSNMDHSFMQGVEAVDNIVLGIPEQTYFSPNHINGNGKSNRRFLGNL